MKLKGKFLGFLKYENIDGRYFRLTAPLKYKSQILRCKVIVPEGFIFDNESIPRLPFIYAWIGRTSDRAGCIHDYFYRLGSYPPVRRSVADDVYREANRARGIGWLARNIKKLGVRIGGGKAYHFYKVTATYKDMTGKDELVEASEKITGELKDTRDDVTETLVKEE